MELQLGLAVPGGTGRAPHGIETSGSPRRETLLCHRLCESFGSPPLCPSLMPPLPTRCHLPADRTRKPHILCPLLPISTHRAPFAPSMPSSVPRSQDAISPFFP